MNKLSEYAGILDSEADLMKRLLLGWQPSAEAETEKDHERDLFQWLTQKLPGVPMIPQYGIAKGHADIVIQDSHLIELKLGFTSVNDFDRCIGQLERYRQKWSLQDRGPVYLVIVGPSDSEFRVVLGNWIELACNNAPLPSFAGPAFYWFEKQPKSAIP